MALSLLLLVVAACSTADRPTLSPAESSAADLVIALTTRPDPPGAGPVELVVQLMDSSGQPIEDAAVNVLASHKTMNGMDMQAEASAQGNGQYVVLADLAMGGEWLVTVEVRDVSPEVQRTDFRFTVK